MFRILLTVLLISFSSIAIANDITEEQIAMTDDNSEEQNLTNDEASDDNFINNKAFATIQILNKITAKIKYLDIKVDSEKSFELLKIKVLSCWQSSPYDLSENKILLDISERKTDSAEYHRVFEGWMFSSSPAISTMEHPIYDVVAISCHDTPK